MSAKADHRAMVRRARGAGCTVSRSRKHLWIVTPNGTRILAASSPSDMNAVHNLRRDLERAGVVL